MTYNNFRRASGLRFLSRRNRAHASIPGHRIDFFIDNLSFQGNRSSGSFRGVIIQFQISLRRYSFCSRSKLFVHQMMLLISIVRLLQGEPARHVQPTWRQCRRTCSLRQWHIGGAIVLELLKKDILLGFYLCDDSCRQSYPR